MLFPKKSLFFLFVLLLLFNFLILSIQSYGYLWYKLFSFILSPSIKLIHNTTNFFSNLVFSYKELKEAIKENKILREKIMWQNIKTGKLLSENIYLKQIYEFDSKPTFFEKIAKAYIIKMDTPSFSSKLIVSAGSSKGIKENQVCITPLGLVGKIYKVEYFNSYLIPIVNMESVVSGVIERTGVHGVIRGDGTGFLQFKYLPPYSDVKENDLVYTDCWDLIYPYGIEIGKVTEVKRQAEELYVKITPSVDFSKLSVVYIIKGASN